MLERLWESTDGRTKTAQVVIPHSKVKEVLTEMHGGLSLGRFGVNKTLDKVKRRYYCLHSRYLLIAMEYFNKWPEVYPIPNRQSTLADALVTNLFCRFRVPR
jgi:thermostable 8-oxoguanine DNA glycosylase